VLTLAFAHGESPPPALSGRLVNSWRNDQEAPFAQAFVDDRRHLISWRDLGIFAFTLDHTHVTVWPVPTASPAIVRDMFMRVIQPVILQAMGWQALHASAVSSPNGAIAFCGVGHSGKSTLAYMASLKPGVEQIADDAILIDVRERAVTLRPLPFRPKLRNPAYAYARQASGRDPHAIATRTVGSAMPLCAFFIVRQSATAPSPAEPMLLPPATAFRELLRHAHCFDERDPAHSRRVLDAYLTIVELVPVFRLCYRPDLAELEALSRVVLDNGVERSVIGGLTPDAPAPPW
jgi:hypothetical protein